METQKIEQVICGKCRFFNRDKNYKYEGFCTNDGRYTRDHRVCDLLDTNEKKLDALISKGDFKQDKK